MSKDISKLDKTLTQLASSTIGQEPEWDLKEIEIAKQAIKDLFIELIGKPLETEELEPGERNGQKIIQRTARLALNEYHAVLKKKIEEL